MFFSSSRFESVPNSLGKVSECISINPVLNKSGSLALGDELPKTKTVLHAALTSRLLFKVALQFSYSWSTNTADQLHPK